MFHAFIWLSEQKIKQEILEEKNCIVQNESFGLIFFT